MTTGTLGRSSHARLDRARCRNHVSVARHRRV